jgi:peptidoglycan/LPS O-acetylase OafA/YrhL
VSPHPAVDRPDESTTGRHVPALDGIRGLAILLVLMEHLFWGGPNQTGMLWFLSQVRATGWIGVNLFFVLSGFLITGILYDTLPSRHFFRNFYARRSLRIFPLYYGFLALLLLITHLRGEYWTPVLWGVLTYTRNLNPAVNWNLTSASWVNVNHFWSLGVEEQFYLAWPLLIFALRHRRRIFFGALAGALLSLGIRIGLSFSSYPVRLPYILYSWTPCCLDCLFLGACLAMLIRSRHRDRVISSAHRMFLGCTAALAVLWCFYPTFTGSNMALPVGMPFALGLTFVSLIAASLHPTGLVGRVFSAPLLRFFGRYSYGLYVYHYTVITIFAHYRAAIVAHGHSAPLANLATGLAAFGVTLAVSYVSFNYFEKRFLGLKDRFHDTSRRQKLHDFVSHS